MTSANIQLFVRADITMVSLVDGTTKTVSVSNRPILATAGTLRLPLIKEITNLGVELGQDGMPVFSGGSLNLINAPGSYGEERKFSDLLDRYSLADQPVVIYDSLTDLGTSDPIWTQRWAGVSRTYSISGDILSIAIDAMAFTQDVTSRTITTVDADAGTPGLGKALPIVFNESGGVQLPAYYCWTSLGGGQDGAYFAYSTAKSGFEDQGGSAIYAKGRGGEYLTIGSSHYYQDNGATAGANQCGITGLTELGTPITLPSGAIISAGYWYFKAQGAGPAVPAGNITFHLYLMKATAATTDGRGNANGWELTSVNSVTIAKSTYGALFNGAVNFKVGFTFPTPTVVGPAANGGTTGESLKVLLAMSLDTVTATPLTTDFVSAPVAAAGTYYIKSSDNSQWISANGYGPMAAVYAPDIYAGGTGADSKGLKLQEIFISEVYKDNYATQPHCDFTGLDLVVEAYGARDNWAGLITGTAFAPLTRPDHIIRYLDLRWNGSTSTWAPSGVFDFSTLASYCNAAFASGNQYYRTIVGALDAGCKIDEAIKAIVKQSCLQICPQGGSGLLAILPWGANQAVKKTFSDENSQVLKFDALATDTIVNSSNLGYLKKIINFTQSAIAANQALQNYAGVITAIGSDSNYWNMFASASFAKFGQRVGSDTTLDLIGDEISALLYLRWLFTTFDVPTRKVTLKTPYTESQSLSIGDIVNVVSAYLPAYFGTTNNARYPTYSGTPDTVVNKGNYLTRANLYRCQIVGKLDDRFNADIPASTLTLRVISPDHINDPS